ncbi:sensor histidine kinase [Xylanibacillus composti]|uniref:histidine kinase n=1 Tax=Xylanibacillus composti TaxID=1572762 RepID=A0A8J4H6P4_9BACL|nr:HAMP domain-containing sensor histidine kinase [Xylanibacillus composti]MDT9724719.1 sensor histidine kinase [Xylanibacillus composti]GIQ70720.1 two-component sensor histidine kinase [Xylanibacillus composti]
MTIRMRLTIWYTSVLAVTLIVFGTALYFFLEHSSLKQYEDNLTRQVNEVGTRLEYARVITPNGVRFLMQLDDSDTFLTQGIYLRLVNLTNMQVSQSSNTMAHRVQMELTRETLNELEEGKRGFFEESSLLVQNQRYPFLVFHQPLYLGERLVGVLQAAVLIQDHREFLSTVRWMLISAVAVTVLAAFSLGWFLARKALAPIEHVIAATDKIEIGDDLGRRIAYDGPKDEIGRLTAKINGMLARIETIYRELEEAYKMQRRFVSDASHELRTPLTTIRGNVDLLEKMWARHQAEAKLAWPEGSDGWQPGQERTEAKEMPEQQLAMFLESMRDIAAEAERMSRLVNDMLSLARADAGQGMQREELPLLPLVEDVARRAAFLERQADWKQGDFSALQDVKVRGHKDYLQQMLFIFIDNAFKYTPQGTVVLDAVRQGDHVGLRIADTGIGMSEEEVPHIFERFYRADVSRGLTAGTGLGLSIAKWIIDEHRGRVEVATAEGQGTVFTIWLPIAGQDGSAPDAV